MEHRRWLVQFLCVIINVQSVRKEQASLPVVIATRSDQVQLRQDFAKQRTAVGDKTGTVNEYRSPNQDFCPLHSFRMREKLGM